MVPSRGDYSDIAAIIQSIISPLTAKLQVLEEKVDRLNQDRVTRSDLDKITAAFVPRDSYEARHAALVDRNLQLENSIRELRKDYETDVQRIHDRLESGKQQLEDRIKQANDVQLSAKDRTWLRWSQVAGFIAIIVAALDWILQHVKIG